MRCSSANRGGRHSVLIVDDQGAVRESLTEWLSPGYDVESAASGAECLRILDDRSFDVLLLDQRMPGMRGEDVLRVVTKEFPDLQVIMMTAFGSVDAAVEAIRMGAEDYLLKPIEPSSLEMRIKRLLGYKEIKEENLQLRRQLDERFSFHSILTKDTSMKAICDRIQVVAKSGASVLITGESGTGKELVARAIHQASDRVARPFVTVACGAIPDTLIEAEIFGHEKGSFTDATSSRVGKFEEVRNGTLFLDEIGELSPAAQVKFLRVMEEREYQRIGSTKVLKLDARVVSATNRDLDEALEQNEFRTDLYYRINTIRIDLPPLRNRHGDVILLAEHFLETYVGQYGKDKLVSIAPEAARVLQRHSWPGNARELKSVMEQATILCQDKTIGLVDLPQYLTEASVQKTVDQHFHRAMDDYGRAVVMEALERAHGVKKDAAERLGMSQRGLSHYLKKYGITT